MKRFPEDQGVGELAILNVGDGDTKLSFDPKNPAECIRAARIVKDMLRRGYALMVATPEGTYQRVLEFRDDVYEYVIADFDPVTAAEHDAQEEEEHEHQQSQTGEGSPSPAAAQDAPRKPGRPRKTVTLPAAGARAVAVGRTAGG